MNNQVTVISEAIIELDSAKIFQQKNLILSEIKFNIRKGEFVYLIGKTGSGKTSLLRILYGDIILKEGSGRIADFKLAGIKRRQIPFLRRKLGIVFQDFQLLTDRSVHANLFFVMKATGWKDKKQIEDRIQEVLEMVELSTKGFKMPHELSGGEQQRVAIARALVNHPDIILADEPTGNLDPETSEGIIRLLFEISKNGSAVVMATHNHSLIQKFPARILKCENGKVKEEAQLMI